MLTGFIIVPSVTLSSNFSYILLQENTTCHLTHCRIRHCTKLDYPVVLADTCHFCVLTVLYNSSLYLLFTFKKLFKCTGCITGNGRFWNGCYGAGREGRGLGRGHLNSSGHAISVAIMPQWTLEHCVFAYDSFVKSGESIIETQRLVCCRFNIGHHGNITSHSTILRWVTSFRTRGTIMKKKPPGPVATPWTPENVERVKEAIVRSPARSAQRHAVELGMSESTVRRISHKVACNNVSFHDIK